MQLAGIVLAVPLRLSSPQVLISMHSLLTGLYIPFCPAHQQLPTHQSSPKSTSLMLCAHFGYRKCQIRLLSNLCLHTLVNPRPCSCLHTNCAVPELPRCAHCSHLLACTGQRNSACNLQQDLNVLEVSSPAFLKVFACCEADVDEHRGGTDRESVACFV